MGADLQLQSVSETEQSDRLLQLNNLRLNRQQCAELWKGIAEKSAVTEATALFLHLHSHFIALYFHHARRSVLLFDPLTHYADSAIEWLRGTDAPKWVNPRPPPIAPPGWTFRANIAGVQSAIDGPSLQSCSVLVAIFVLVLLQLQPDDALGTCFHTRGCVSWWRNIVGRFHHHMSHST